MKPNNLKHSMLTVGVIAALGLTQSALAVEASQPDETVQITNKATANYSVGGVAQPEVESNEVIVNVTKQISFTLVDNRTADVTPEGNVTFNHTLTNSGNVKDTYTIDIANVDGDDFDFDLGAETTTVKYKREGETSYTDLPSNKKIILEPGEIVEIQVTTKAVSNDKEEEGQLTVSATSEVIPAGGNDANKLTNTDTATTITPVFAINKKLTSAANIAQGSDATISYQIVVSNTGNMDADDVTITDQLPNGLKFSDTPNIVVKRGSAVITDTVSINTDNDTLTITGVNIAQASGDSQDITVTFDTKVKSSADTANNTFANKATVTDEVGGTIIEDNTDQNTNLPGDSTDNNDSNPSVVTITTSDVVITPPGDVTLPPNGNTIIKHTITNNGTHTEDNLRLKLTTLENKDSSNITQTFYIDKNGDGEANAGEEYTLGEKLPTLAPDESIVILVKETASNAMPGTDNTSIEKEKYQLGLTTTPDGSGDPVASVEDSIKVAGLELKKEQAVAGCKTTPADGDFSKDPADAKPGQCIFYKITAINHLPTSNPAGLQDFTDVTVSDTIEQLGSAVGQVTYRTDVAGNNINVSYSEPTVSGTAATLAAQQKATVTFSVKINQ